MNLQPECRRYLESMNSTLWGRSFDIINGDLDAAAEWLNEQVNTIAGTVIDQQVEDYRLVLRRWKEEQVLRLKAEERELTPDDLAYRKIWNAGYEDAFAEVITERALADQLAGALRETLDDEFGDDGWQDWHPAATPLAAWEEARRG